MTAEENKAVIRRWIEEAWNEGNVNIADEIYSRDYTAKDVDDPNKILHGPEDIKKSVIMMRAVFPDIHFTIDHLIAEGEKVVGAFTITGTHKGDFGSIAATGKKVTFTAVDIWRFEGGKIAQRYIASVDRLGLLQQFGAVPPIGSTT
ncbi:MAG: ester cyclase [Candidatus Hodarchaeota archaeon]